MNNSKGENLYGLNATVIQKIQTVFAHYPSIETALLYGSRAMGTYHNGSDIDLTFLGKTLTADVLYRLDDELDDLLLAYSFDLSLHQEIDNPSLLDHIQRVGRVFYQKN